MKDKVIHHCKSGNAVYGLGFIGAAIYHIMLATGFWMGVVGFLKLCGPPFSCTKH